MPTLFKFKLVSVLSVAYKGPAYRKLIGMLVRQGFAPLAMS